MVFRHTERALTLILLSAGFCHTGCSDSEPSGSGDSTSTGGGSAGSAGSSPVVSFEEAKVLIEHNAADNDTGFQLFVDGDPWRNLTVSGPAGDVLEVEARGVLQNFGLTEMFFETKEPAADELPLEDVLAVLPEGDYTFTGETVAGEAVSGVAVLTHDIPQPAEISAPVAGAVVDPDQDLLVSWQAVTSTLDDRDLEVIGYQVIVVRDLELLALDGFSKPHFSIYVPAETTSVSVPNEFLEPGTPYEIEVLTLEVSGNQTIALTSFETTGSADLPEEQEPDPSRFTDTKFLIEHNAADQDTGYQLFLDGEPWARVVLAGSPGELLGVTAQGALGDYGLTEMFFETHEPEASETPLEDVLGLCPEGAYEYTGRFAEGGAEVSGTATLTHVIPVMPQITAPEADAEVAADEPLVVSWQPVSESLSGADIEIVGYEVIVVEDLDRSGHSFYHAEMDVHVPPTTTSISVPAEFLAPGTDYEIEVLALEASGNQTIGLSAFQTR